MMSQEGCMSFKTSDIIFIVDSKVSYLNMI